MEREIPSVRGVVLEQSPYAIIKEGFPYNEYLTQEEPFTQDEIKMAAQLAGALNRSIHTDEWLNQLGKMIGKSFPSAFKIRILSLSDSMEVVEKLPTQKEYDTLREKLEELLNEFKPNVNDIPRFVGKVLDDGIGYGFIGTPMRDPELEEIMVNGTQRNIFVYHRKHGMCKTDLLIEGHDQNMGRIIDKAANYAGRTFGEKEPLLDARLPDGSRLNATFETITPFGRSLTIRKFTAESFSIIDLIAKGTLSTELAAFLWTMVEGMNVQPMNLIVTGGAGCGKTSLLNALSSVIRYRERIITIEDTTELQFQHRENWVSLESKPRIGSMRGTSMNDLLTNAMRMRPDRIIVGEVRGEEAQTLFVAMDTGHQGILGTLHSNTAREMLVRLTTEPMNVPQSLLHLLNLIVVLQRVHDPKRGMQRRVMQVAEVSHLDKNVLLSNLFERNPDTDVVLRTDTPSHIMQELADISGKGKQHIMREIEVREKILEWMLKHHIHQSGDVEKVIQEYYFDPTAVLEQINKEL
ncbi:MAG: ATPase, T2SS/T4P/T4SS family [Candidatus Diapherotrites archaeon]